MVCEEKGIDYTLTEMPLRAPEIFAIHPFGKMPVLRHGEFELCESKAIATYLDRGFPGAQLIPSDLRLAALTEQWVSLVNTRIDGTLVRTYLLNYIFPKGSDGSPDRKIIDAVVPAVKEEIDLLDRTIANGGFLAGDSFTFADINVLPILAYLKELVDDQEYTEELLRWLARWDTEYAKFVDPKVQLLTALEDRKQPGVREQVERFLEDVHEPSRFHAASTNGSRSALMLGCCAVRPNKRRTR